MISYFEEEWKESQISEHLSTYGVLVLFAVDLTIFGREARMLVYGKLMGEFEKELLKNQITLKFGGENLNDRQSHKINDFAQRWYSKNILHRRARVINIEKKMLN